MASLDLPILFGKDIINLDKLKSKFVEFRAKRLKEDEKELRKLPILGLKEGRNEITHVAICSTSPSFKKIIKKEIEESPGLIETFEDKMNDKFFGCVVQPALSNNQVQQYLKLRDGCRAKDEDIDSCIEEGLKKIL